MVADNPLYPPPKPLSSMEKDPYGIDQHAPGAKLDAGKARLSLVLLAMSRALSAVGEVGTYGAAKYTDNGWLEVPNGQERYMDALFRHLLQHATGELHDRDTGLTHLAHACWNMLAVLELSLRGKTGE